MKHIFSILITLLPIIEALGQIYTDPAVAGAMAAHSIIINNQLDGTNERLTLIERGQLAITGNLTIVNDMQNKIYTGLSEVSAVLTNLSSVQEITRIGLLITSDIQDIMELAGENPVLLAFAEQNANLFQQRATRLAIEVSSFVLNGGESNLMDAGERSKLLNTILTELMILRSYTYGMYRSMYYAQMRGILKSLNPFQGYIEMDIRIMEDIVRKRKVLQ